MVLHLFPEGGLAESVTTTVWVGVFVVALFNLRFGWTFSGLVTPGYIVPLMILRPWSALMIFVEAAISYWLVWLYSQYMSRWGKWSSFFGRDRFFAIVLASIGVKVVLDGYGIPWLGRWLQDRFGLSIDLGNTLHSFGLIVVALLANQFWKPGFVRGLGPVCVVVGITYLIVRYPLLHLTNFSIGNLEYLYEDVATSVLAGPKAYVILVITAFVASRMNLLYSWDYNGILIPALLALQWYEPLKVLSSLVEAYVVYLVGSLVLQLPAFRETTIEGARKILLFFNISYAYKLVLGHLHGWLQLDLPAADLYGFGYLLPSLMALKMHDKKIPIRLARTTIQTCLVGAAAACVLGFGLTVVTQSLVRERPPPIAEASELAESRPLRLVEQLDRWNYRSYGRRFTVTPRSPLASEVQTFGRGLKALARHLAEGKDEHLAEARAWLDRVGYHVTRGHGGVLYLEEREPGHGWGLYALRPEPRSPILVSVPAPQEEWAAIEAGGYIFEEVTKARALAISTLISRPGAPASKQILTGHGSFFNEFHRVFSTGGVLQIRGYTERSARSLLGKKVRVGTEEMESLPTTLWISRGVPPGLDLDELLSSIKNPESEVRWKRPPIKNLARDISRGGFAELFLSRKDRKRIMPKFLLGIGDDGPPASPDDWLEVLRETGLERLLAEIREDIAPRGSNLYAPPSVETLLFFDEEILKPLLKVASASGGVELHTPEVLAELAPVARAAQVFHYNLVVLEDPSLRDFLVLREDGGTPDRKYWGSIVLRVGEARPFVVEVPRPIYEQNTLEYGLELFERLRARCLLIAGANPKANVDASADVTLPSNSLSVFNLTNQVLLRESGDEPLLVVQVRALGPRPGRSFTPADALVSFADGSWNRESLGNLERDLVRILDKDRLSWRFVDGDESTGGYEAQGSAQARYLSQTRAKNFAALWLSPFMRLGYRNLADDAVEQNQLAALGIPTEESDGDLYEILSSTARGPVLPEETELRRLILEYRKLQNIMYLYAVTVRWEGISPRRIVDGASQKPFLLFTDGEGRLAPLVARLGYEPGLDAAHAVERSAVKAATLSRKVVREFVESGAAFLILEAGR